MPRENTIVKASTRVLTKRGAWWVNIHGSGVGRNGIPDVLATYRGRSLALEHKQPGRKPTRLQQHELDQASRAGAISAVITSAAETTSLLDTIDAELDQAGPTRSRQ